MKKFGIILRIIFTAAFLFCLIWVNVADAFNAGSVIGTIIFGAGLAVCVFWGAFKKLLHKIWQKLAGKIALIAAGTFVFAGIAAAAFFSVNMVIYEEVPVDDLRAVIVLGCQVKGEEPSDMLKGRLNAALELLSEHSDAVCIVSGGKGKGEDISEAEAMRRYLVENGISESRIFTESRSTNTRENMRLSVELLKERGIIPYEKDLRNNRTENSVPGRATPAGNQSTHYPSDNADIALVVVTNEFHQYRAEIYARKFGISVGHHSTRTPPWALLNYWVREWAAILSAITGLF